MVHIRKPDKLAERRQRAVERGFIVEKAPALTHIAAPKVSSFLAAKGGGCTLAGHCAGSIRKFWSDFDDHTPFSWEDRKADSCSATTLKQDEVDPLIQFDPWAEAAAELHSSPPGGDGHKCSYEDHADDNSNKTTLALDELILARSDLIGNDHFVFKLIDKITEMIRTMAPATACASACFAPGVEEAVGANETEKELHRYDDKQLDLEDLPLSRSEASTSMWPSNAFTSPSSQELAPAQPPAFGSSALEEVLALQPECGSASLTKLVDRIDTMEKKSPHHQGCQADLGRLFELHQGGHERFDVFLSRAHRQICCVAA